MLNFIRFDIRKLFSMKAVLVFILLVLGFMFVSRWIGYEFTYYDNYDDYRAAHQQYLESDQERQDSEETMFHFEITPSDQVMSERVFKVYMAEFREDYDFNLMTLEFFLTLVATVWIPMGIFMGNDFSSGYFKNLLTIPGARSHWLLAKVNTSLLMGCIFFLASLLTAFLMSLLTGFGIETIQWKLLGQHFVLGQLEMLMLTGLSAGILLLTQSKTASLVLGLTLSTGIVGSLLNSLSQLIQIDLTQLLYSNQYSQFGMELKGDLTKLFILAIPSLLIIYGFNYIRIKRMDFKFPN